MLVLGCIGNDKPKRPTNLISKADMETILYDLYIINGAKGVNGKLLENNGFLPETYILEKHGIDSLQFATSNDYYAFDTEQYKGIIENVKAKLEQKKGQLEALEKEKAEVAKRKRDSLRKKGKKKQDSIRKVMEKQKDTAKYKLQELSIDN